MSGKHFGNRCCVSCVNCCRNSGTVDGKVSRYVRKRLGELVQADSKRPRFIGIAEDAPADQVVDHFVSSIGIGAAHLSDVNKTARALAKKHPEDEGYKFFASLGSSGKNVEHDFRRRTRYGC